MKKMGLRTKLPEPAQPLRRALQATMLGSALALVLALTAAPARAQGVAAALGLPALMAQLAQRKGGEARFTEERTVSSLENTLRASGRLSFQAPDRFARYTEEPRAESMEVQGNQVVMKRGTRTRQMALDAIPEMAALADALRGTLNGDAGALQRHFNTQVSGNAGRWVLLLTPLDSRLARSVQQLEIAGTGSDVHSVDLRLVGGDRSLMLITPLTPAAAAPAPK